MFCQMKNYSSKIFMYVYVLSTNNVDYQSHILVK